MTFLRVLVDSFVLLRRCPKFFIPKILVAFLFLPVFFLFSRSFMQVQTLSISQISTSQVAEVQLLLFQLLLTLAYLLLVNFIDAFFVNPMYPVMVQQFYNSRKIDFRNAFRQVLRRFGTIFSALAIVSLIIMGALAPFLFIILNVFWMQDLFLLYLSIAAFLVVAFFVMSLTYLFYPLGSLEKINFASLIGKTFRISFKHRANVVKAISISFLLSAVSILLALMIEWVNAPEYLLPVLGMFSLFIVVRVITAIFITYHYVLNAVFYLGLEKGQFFKP